MRPPKPVPAAQRALQPLAGQMRTLCEGHQLGARHLGAKGDEAAVGGGLELCRVVVAGGCQQAVGDPLRGLNGVVGVVDAAEEDGLGGAELQQRWV